jgi:hypothetical protein
MLETESGVELVVVLEMESRVELVVVLVVMLELDSAVALVVVWDEVLALMKAVNLELMIMMAGYLDLMTDGYLKTNRKAQLIVVKRAQMTVILKDYCSVESLAVMTAQKTVLKKECYLRKVQMTVLSVPLMQKALNLVLMMRSLGLEWVMRILHPTLVQLLPSSEGDWKPVVSVVELKRKSRA